MSKLFCSCLKDSSKLSQSSFKVVTKLFQSDPNVVLKLSHSCPTIVLKMYKSWSKCCPCIFQWCQVISIYVNICGPGICWLLISACNLAAVTRMPWYNIVIWKSRRHHHLLSGGLGGPMRTLGLGIRGTFLICANKSAGIPGPVCTEE